MVKKMGEKTKKKAEKKRNKTDEKKTIGEGKSQEETSCNQTFHLKSPSVGQ